MENVICICDTLGKSLIFRNKLLERELMTVQTNTFRKYSECYFFVIFHQYCCAVFSCCKHYE